MRPGACRLAALGLAHDPVAHPLTYPGAVPEVSGLLAGDRFAALREPDGEPPGRWLLHAPSPLRAVPHPPPRTADGPPGPDAQAPRLDDVLRRWGCAPLSARTPVLAVGSNAAPAQLRRKLAGRADPVVPMTYARVRGLVPGVSAHVGRPGYVPAAPLLAPGESARLVVLWLDEAQLTVVDGTEPNYRRVRLPGAAEVSMPGLGRLAGCDVYAGRHGCLRGPGGAPLRLAAQPVLIAGLLAGSAALARTTAARTPEEFVANARRSPELRERVRNLWRHTGLAFAQPGLRADP